MIIVNIMNIIIMIHIIVISIQHHHHPPHHLQLIRLFFLVLTHQIPHVRCKGFVVWFLGLWFRAYGLPVAIILMVCGCGVCVQRHEHHNLLHHSHYHHHPNHHYLQAQAHRIRTKHR